jgi:hypothetical protein
MISQKATSGGTLFKNAPFSQGIFYLKNRYKNVTECYEQGSSDVPCISVWEPYIKQMKCGDTHPVVLEGIGLPGNVQFRIDIGHLSIIDEKGNLSIPEERLDRIEYRLGSWRTGGCSPAIRLAIRYRQGDGHTLLKQLILSGEDKRNVELLHQLENRYPDIAFIGPNESEKDNILAATWHSAHALHSLHILTPVGIVMGLLMVSVLNVSLILAEDLLVRAVSLQAISQARNLLLVFSLVPVTLMALILGKMLMVLRTDPEGLTIRRVFSCKRIPWRDVEIGKPRSDVFNVYTGLFCYYSDRVNVVSSRSLIEIPLLVGGKAGTTLRLNLEEAGPLFRELYYRAKVTLQTAQKVGAFI